MLLNSPYVLQRTTQDEAVFKADYLFMYIQFQLRHVGFSKHDRKRQKVKAQKWNFDTKKGNRKHLFLNCVLFLRVLPLLNSKLKKYCFNLKKILCFKR